jgi:hypothetical protein
MGFALNRRRAVRRLMTPTDKVSLGRRAIRKLLPLGAPMFPRVLSFLGETSLRQNLRYFDTTQFENHAIHPLPVWRGSD